MCSHGKFVSTNGVITCGLCGQKFTPSEYKAFIKPSNDNANKGKNAKDKSNDNAGGDVDNKEGV